MEMLMLVAIIFNGTTKVSEITQQNGCNVLLLSQSGIILISNVKEHIAANGKGLILAPLVLPH